MTRGSHDVMMTASKCAVSCRHEIGACRRKLKEQRSFGSSQSSLTDQHQSVVRVLKASLSTFVVALCLCIFYSPAEANFMTRMRTMALALNTRSPFPNEGSGVAISIQQETMSFNSAIPVEDSDDNCSLADTVSCGSSGIMEDDNDEVVRGCDACPHCDDVCENRDCSHCAPKRSRRKLPGSPVTVVECGPLFPKVEHTYYTPCQVRRHIHADSCWLVAGDTIYDATPFLKSHPGGVTCILRSAGGRKDCTKDISLHSKRAKQMWNNHIVGKLQPCGCCTQPKQPSSSSSSVELRPWWLFWP